MHMLRDDCERVIPASCIQKNRLAFTPDLLHLFPAMYYIWISELWDFPPSSTVVITGLITKNNVINLQYLKPSV